MAVSDVLELGVDYGVHQRPLKQRWWYQVLTDPSDTDRIAQDLVDAFLAAAIHTAMAALCSDQTLFDCVKSYVRFAIGPFAKKNAAPGYKQLDIAGTRPTGEALPDSLPLVIEWEQTAVSAVANGRLFLSGIREDDTDGNRITSAFQTGALATFETAIEATQTPSGITGPDGGVFRQILVSNEDSLVVDPLNPYGNPLDVTGTTCNPVLKNQKRRQSRWEGASHA